MLFTAMLVHAVIYYHVLNTKTSIRRVQSLIATVLGSEWPRHWLSYGSKLVTGLTYTHYEVFDSCMPILRIPLGSRVVVSLDGTSTGVDSGACETANPPHINHVSVKKLRLSIHLPRTTRSFVGVHAKYDNQFT